MKRFLYIPDKLLCWKTINTFFSRLIKCQEVFRVHWFERIYIYIYFRFRAWTFPSLLKQKVENWQDRSAAESCSARSEGLAAALEERLDEGSCSWWGLRSRPDVLHSPPAPGCYSFVRVLISRTAKFLSNSDMRRGSPQQPKKKKKPQQNKIEK